MTLGGDSDLLVYPNQLPRTNEAQEQTEHFWFPTLKISIKTEGNSPIQTGIFNESYELRTKEKLKLMDEVGSRNKSFEELDWTGTLLTKAQKQAF